MHEPHQRRAPLHSSSPVASSAMENLDEIPESPDLGEQTIHKSSTTESPTTKKRRHRKHSSSASQSQRRRAVNNDTPTPASEDGVAVTSSDFDGPRTQWATINERSSKQHPRKPKNQKNGRLQDSYDIGGSPELGANSAAVSSAPGNAPSSKKRKNSEMSGSNSKKSKYNHDANITADPPSTFSSLAETLYKHRKKEQASNQRPESRDSSDHNSDANGVDEDVNEDTADTVATDDADEDIHEDADEDADEDAGENEVENEHSDADPSYRSDGDISDGNEDGEGSFAPQDASVDNSSVATSSTPTKRAAGKRVAKRTFFQRLAQEEASGETGDASSSVAGPSKSSKGKQPKISTILRGKTKGNPDENTPSATHPHELATGAFSEFELRNITQAVERWRDEHELTQEQVNNLIQGNPKEVKSQEFWARVVATCPNRKRQKIINQCRRKFHNFVARGKWTTEQHDELKRLWEIHGNKYSVIGKLINRYPEDVRDRVRNYVVCGDNRRSDPWTKEEENKLESIISEALAVIRAEQENGAIPADEPEEELIDWQRVSVMMDRTRSRLQCITKWKLMMRQKQAGEGSIDGSAVASVHETVMKAREEAEAMSSEERYNLIKAIRAYRTQADSRIPWAKIREKKMGPQWTRPTLMLVWYRLKHSVADWDTMAVPEISKQLSKQYHETKELPFPDGEDYDFDDEYADIEKKVEKIIKHQTRKAKVESDDDIDDDDDDEDGEAYGQQREENSEVGESSNGQLNGADTPMEDEAEDEADHELSGSISRSSSVDVRSISNFRPTMSRRGQKTYSSRPKKSSALKEMPSKRTPVKGKGKAVAVPEAESSEDDEPEDEDELSSDTNASDASSIPARL
ncbi:Sphingosine N-acyltransferase lag1 [Hypoxylon texense]